MDFTLSMVQTAMSMKAEQIRQSYDMGVQKMAMNAQSGALEEMLALMPQQAVAPKGELLDVFA